MRVSRRTKLAGWAVVTGKAAVVILGSMPTPPSLRCGAARFSILKLDARLLPPMLPFDSPSPPPFTSSPFSCDCNTLVGGSGDCLSVSDASTLNGSLFGPIVASAGGGCKYLESWLPPIMWLCSDGKPLNLPIGCATAVVPPCLLTPDDISINVLAPVASACEYPDAELRADARPPAS